MLTCETSYYAMFMVRHIVKQKVILACYKTQHCYNIVMMINTMVRITFNINYWLCIINMYYIAKLGAQLVNIKYISEGEGTLSLESGTPDESKAVTI